MGRVERLEVKVNTTEEEKDTKGGGDMWRGVFASGAGEVYEDEVILARVVVTWTSGVPGGVPWDGCEKFVILARVVLRWSWGGPGFAPAFGRAELVIRALVVVWWFWGVFSFVSSI